MPPLVALLPNDVRIALGFVLFDLLFYWAHRWAHRVPLLWRFHGRVGHRIVVHTGR